jgi:hypothetical protein
MDPVLRVALRKHNELRQQLDNVLLGDNGDKWEKEFKNFLAQRPCWSNGQVMQVPQPKTKSSIFEHVPTVVISATTGKFVAKDKFVVNTSHNAPVKISAVGVNFTDSFLLGDGKIEDPISEQKLRYQKLCKESVDGLIITELGGEAKAETTLSEMFSLMENQSNGEYGVLLTNRKVNIFYIRNQRGFLSAVYVLWYKGGWSVEERGVGFLYSWHNGNQVFSRNSVLETS